MNKKLPETPHTNEYLNWSDPVTFECAILGKCAGTYYSNSNGFFRDEKTGFDTSAHRIKKWRYKNDPRK